MLNMLIMATIFSKHSMTSWWREFDAMIFGNRGLEKLSTSRHTQRVLVRSPKLPSSRVSSTMVTACGVWHRSAFYLCLGWPWHVTFMLSLSMMLYSMPTTWFCYIILPPVFYATRLDVVTTTRGHANNSSIVCILSSIK
jgi:hypothetical protein